MSSKEEQQRKRSTIALKRNLYRTVEEFWLVLRSRPALPLLLLHPDVATLNFCGVRAAGKGVLATLAGLLDAISSGGGLCDLSHRVGCDMESSSSVVLGLFHSCSLMLSFGETFAIVSALCK